MPTPQEPYVTHSLHRNPELSHNHGLDLSLNSSLTVRSYNICLYRSTVMPLHATPCGFILQEPRAANLTPRQVPSCDESAERTYLTRIHVPDILRVGRGWADVVSCES